MAPMSGTREKNVSSSSNKPNMKLSIKKIKRIQSKKRKLKSYLKLALAEESLTNRKKMNSNSKEVLKGIKLLPSDDIPALRNHLRVLKRQEDQKPDFYLASKGIKAKIFDNELALSCIFLEDVQHLIVQACLRIYSPVQPRWCRLLKASKLSHIVIVSVCGVTSEDFINNNEAFEQTLVTFPDIVQMFPPSSFHAEITHFPAVLNYMHIDNLSSKTFPTQPLKCLMPPAAPEIVRKSQRAPVKDVLPRMKLLLSVVQMISEDYPLPIVSGRNTDDFQWSLPNYADVTDSSPLFAIDCEMCITSTSQRELTRVSIVDEKYNVLLDTLVKPENKIIDYVTRYSGITESMLAGVKTTLRDVQEYIREILPNDAIICGQSLNFDLHVLKLFHPYVIDTSVIYNLSGRRQQKSSLKHLSSVFLKEDIQMGNDGHCSVEDSTATMKLVQKKLENGIEFGDNILSEDSYSHGDNQTADSLFPMILAQQKAVCVIGSTKNFREYPDKSLPGEVKRFVRQGTEECVECITQEAMNHNVILSHLDVPETDIEMDRYAIIDQSISKIYKACAVNALVVVVCNGYLPDRLNGLCMVKIKDI